MEENWLSDWQKWENEREWQEDTRLLAEPIPNSLFHSTHKDIARYFVNGSEQKLKNKLKSPRWEQSKKKEKVSGVIASGSQMEDKDKWNDRD